VVSIIIRLAHTLLSCYFIFLFIILFTFIDVEEDEHLLACLLMVLVAVSIPKLARNENSFYRASLEGHANNIHCMAAAVNNIFGALFSICGQGDTEDRMKEFLAVSFLLD